MTNSEISFTVRDGRLHGKCMISDTSEQTVHLTASSPVHNNTWHVRGVFATETEAALAARDYLNYTGPVWGVDQYGYDDTEVRFGKPKIAKGFEDCSIRTLAI